MEMIRFHNSILWKQNQELLMQNRLKMLRIYCAAVEAGSFKEAATRLGTSPRAVTRAVQEAEALVGEILFHRNTRRVRATEAGEAFAHRARDLVRQLDELLRTYKRES